MAEAYLTEEVPDALDGERVDRLVAMLADCSRAEATELVKAGGVAVGGEVVTKASQRVATGDVVEVGRDPHRTLHPPTADPAVEVRLVHVDPDVFVVDKPPGLVVHPGPGHADGTLVHGLLALDPGLAHVGDPQRPGLVHRLDRGTSGLLVVARTPDAHASLGAQLSSHAVGRVYDALVWGHPDNPHGIVDAPIGRSRRDPLRMTVAMDGRDARTHYREEQRFSDPVEVTRLTCELETGRTHQIRVHMRSIGHPVVGDDLYGGVRESFGVERPFLHARRLSFVHPRSGEQLVVDCALPDDLASVLRRLS